MKLYIDYILTLYIYISSNLVMQPDQEFVKEPLNPSAVLCTVGIPVSTVEHIVKGVMILTLSQNDVDLKMVIKLINIITAAAAVPGKDVIRQGNAYLFIADESSKKSNRERMVWMLCALICMNSDSQTDIYHTLNNCGLNEIAEALRDNSLHNLSCALAKIDPGNLEYDIQLIFAFLKRYPDEFCAQFPDTPPAQKYKLIRALGNALGSGIISKTVLVCDEGHDEGRIPSLQDLAQLLLEGLTQHND